MAGLNYYPEFDSPIMLSDGEKFSDKQINVDDIVYDIYAIDDTTLTAVSIQNPSVGSFSDNGTATGGVIELKAGMFLTGHFSEVEVSTGRLRVNSGAR